MWRLQALLLAVGAHATDPSIDTLKARGRPRDLGEIVIGLAQAQAKNITGLEGSFYTRTSDGVYHVRAVR